MWPVICIFEPKMQTYSKILFQKQKFLEISKNYFAYVSEHRASFGTKNPIWLLFRDDLHVINQEKPRYFDHAPSFRQSLFVQRVLVHSFSSNPVFVQSYFRPFGFRPWPIFVQTVFVQTVRLGQVRLDKNWTKTEWTIMGLKIDWTNPGLDENSVGQNVVERKPLGPK